MDATTASGRTPVAAQPAAPLRIGVWGQFSTGKSSQIFDLAGLDQRHTDPSPCPEHPPARPCPGPAGVRHEEYALPVPAAPRHRPCSGQLRPRRSRRPPNHSPSTTTGTAGATPVPALSRPPTTNTARRPSHRGMRGSTRLTAAPGTPPHGPAYTR